MLKAAVPICIEALSCATLEDYLNSLTHLAYTTHQRHQAIIQALFNFAVEQGHLSTNPIARLRRRKPDPNKGEYTSDQVIRYLTPEQLQQLYQVIPRTFASMRWCICCTAVELESQRFWH